MKAKKREKGVASYFILTLLAVIFILPVLIILMNSFKGRFFISNDPFSFPNADTFVGFENFLTGLTRIEFLTVFKNSLIITLGSTALIVLFTAMTAWYLVRIKNFATNLIYYLFVFSMAVPFQMVMFTMAWIAQSLGLDTPFTIIPLYLGFGSGLSVFMYSGFVKSVPMDIEEAATIDGCGPMQTFFMVVFPLMKPTAITIAILNAMWIWNDYLLPLLVLKDQRTIPMAVQAVLTGSYGARDIGALMAMLVLSIIPIIVFYLACQKYIIKGVIAGAVKG